MFTTLISPQQLAERLDSPSLIAIDCRFDLMKPDAGEQAYAANHIPGALFAHMERDLSGPKSPTTGRHPLPSIAALARTFGCWGIDAGKQVIAYDADAGPGAARLWWLLRWLGHDAVAVLDGGFKAWQAAQLPISTAAATAKSAAFEPTVRDAMLVDAEFVERCAREPAWRILDARAPERFSGQVEPIDPVAGHIPGARNHPFALNLDANSQFLPAAELAARYRRSIDDIAPDRVIAMCGSGVTACHNLLAMEAAGLRGAKLYAGSWSEWIRDPTRPVARHS